MGERHDTWGFVEGDEITRDLTAMKLLGGGEVYEAYLAFDDVTYGPVVVKVVRPDQVSDARSLRGLRREVDTLSRVNHPAVVRGLRSEPAGDRPHVVLEHLDGPRLSSLVRRYGPLQEQQYLPLAIEVASALHYLHRVGYVHLDVKPSNIIMGAPARLIDLSVARTLEDAARLDHPVGTDAYMAPEQCGTGDYAGRIGPPADVWGLAATVQHALTGEVPFPREKGARESDDPLERWPQLDSDPTPLPEGAPQALREVITAGLAKDPGGRPTAAEFAAALQPVLAGLPERMTLGRRRTA